jgi:uncharacterized membrane protein YcjF (UPF0283 family)
MKPRSERGTRPAEPRAFQGSGSRADDGRHPADEVGRPKQIPSGTHAPTEAELSAVRAGEEFDAKRIYAQIVEQATLNRFNKWRTWLNSTLTLVVLAAAAVTALFVFANTVQAVAILSVQPVPVRLVGYAGLAALLALVAVFSFRLCILFRRLRVNQQISTAQLKELSRRAELRELVQRDKVAAKTNLEAYLRGYPLDGIRDPGVVGTLRLDEETIKKLRDARDFLLDPDRFADHDSWLKDFQVHFQGRLHDAANSVVHDWMKLVGVQTALSPKSWVDSLIVLYCSYGMIGDLCRLYNLRMTGPGIVRLLALSLFNSYAAVQLEDLAQSVDIDTLAQSLDLDTFFDVAHGTFAGGLKKFVPKVADGAANAILTNKLGRATIALLSPVDTRGG